MGQDSSNSNSSSSLNIDNVSKSDLDLELLHKRYIEVYRNFTLFQDLLHRVYGIELVRYDSIYDFREMVESGKFFLNGEHFMELYRQKVERCFDNSVFSKKVPYVLRRDFMALTEEYTNLRRIVGEDFAAKVDTFLEFDVDDVFNQINSSNLNVNEDTAASASTSVPTTADSNSNYDSFRDFVMRIFEKVITRTNAHIASSIVPDNSMYTASLYPVEALVESGACYFLVDKDVYEKNEKQPPPAWPFRPEYFKPYHSKTDNLIEGLAYIVHALRKLEHLDQNQNLDKKCN